MKYTLFLMTWLLLVGCSPRLSTLVTQPADVSIHPRVTKITLINRAQNEHTTAIRNTFVEQSQKSKLVRYTISDGQQIFNDLAVPLNGPVPRSALEELCERAAVNGVLVLNRFDLSSERDTSTSDQTTTTAEGKEQTVRVYSVSYSAEMQAQWSFRGCAGQTYDSYDARLFETWSAEGDTPGDARSALGDEKQLSLGLSELVGEEYFRRIAPYEVTLTRTPYTACGGGFKDGVNELKSERWEQAFQIYSEMLPDLQGRKRGKALYNMAIAKEMLGELSTAQKYARRAHRILSNGKTERLLTDVERRKKAADRLDAQMKQAERENEQINE